MPVWKQLLRELLNNRPWLADNAALMLVLDRLSMTEVGMRSHAPMVLPPLHLVQICELALLPFALVFKYRVCLAWLLPVTL